MRRYMVEACREKGQVRGKAARWEKGQISDKRTFHTVGCIQRCTYPSNPGAGQMRKWGL